MNNFDYTKFDKIFETKVSPKLLQLENERKKTLKNIFLTLLVYFVICAAICSYIIANLHGKYNLSILSQSNLIILESGAVMFTSCLSIIAIFIFDYKKMIKKKFYKQIFHSLGFKYSFSYNDAEAEINYICKNSKLFGKYRYVEVDDVIDGKFKDLPFTIYDTHIYNSFKNAEEKEERFLKKTIFKGIVLTSKITKPLNCNILIKSDKLLKFKAPSDYELVRLEDPEFEKYFDVYSDNQIEARYILTTSFMNRLLEYRKNKRVGFVEIAISNKISDDKNVFFFINNYKNNFEVPLIKTILNKQVFANIIKDFTDALDVINELKLDQNIGL